MATTYYNDLQKLYVAYFNRPADTAGLAYYEGVLENAKGDAKAVAATMASISASFAASAEYKAAYANMSNADVVNAVYQNLFGRPAEDAGKAYWAGLLDAKKITIDAVVTQVAGGAQGSDLTAYNNKVAASLAFTNALGTTNAYSGDKANAAAKAFLSGITDNASFAAATDTYALGATIAKVNAAGTPFTLQSGLAAMDAANTAHNNFLDAFDGKADGKITKTDADVTGAVTTATTKVAGLVDAALPANEKGLYGASTTSATVKAALLSEAQANLAAKLTADQKTLADANAAVAKVAGLTDALAQLTAANTAVDNANAAVKAAGIDLAAKLGAFNAQNTAVTVAADGTVTGLITLDTKGNLVLATGVTETTNPGVTALLASSVAKEAADASLTSASTAQTTAQATVSGLDLTDQAKTDLKAIASAMTIVKLDAGATPTSAQITTELSSLQAIKTSAESIAAQTGATQAQKDAAVAAAKAYNDFNSLVTTFKTDDNADPLIKAQADATASVKTDSDAVSALTKALADLSTANASKAQLDAVNGQIKAASDAFTANNLLQPVTLDAAHAAPLATAGADIFVAGKTNATITNFGLLGNDALYLGSKYTLNTTGDTTKGNDAVLEAFIVKNGADTNIVLEQKAYASSSGTDLVTITLTGVDSTKVHLNNGIITVS
ncbi:DUF4214 domain-containing protein [Massilia sp. 2TAF26]|uniref:DUF4214 domain-containing protein n=1 Tax=Massilia sp. 2TAF26 TaxID=3233012 RepID=UPI003F9443A3